ncbi:Beta-galactosidase 11 [Dendrobium catenatum]|uniref:Beta-galactosidase n=1 Tax=Dendrobium catenatum TaxID=906689 RepID=A0A2I0VM84_9ASPA|nr:Beta-galactosidase 11 [Dendrobium catenatum]
MAAAGRRVGLLLSLFATVVAVSASNGGVNNRGVSYDSRSLIINGKRELLFSGSIHYPRSTPDMWPGIIANAKKGGINLIQTYVFWNGHEPVQGRYNFEGRYDLVKFIRLIQKEKLYVTLRIGPFIQAEWNHGGFPYWLREVKNITFRTNNPPFKYHMEKFVRKIVDMMKEEKLFASQGGPIILAQIENEYNMVQAAFGEDGKKYVQWAADFALSLGIGVPWMMCKQQDAPGPIINSCNGRNCGDTWKGPNHPTKPLIWAENWTAQYRVFGDPPSQRSAEDLAFSVARFFSKNGTLANYYMYHGGTNFGRTGSAFVTTRYYDEAPLDEYGLQKQPKWGHLKDLHRALKLSKKPLLWGSYSFRKLGKDVEARVYDLPSKKVCAAFLTNKKADRDYTVSFHGVNYFLPRHSISILPDCKTEVFNTQRINAQHNSRTFIRFVERKKKKRWEMYQDHIPRYHDKGIVHSPEPLELMNMTKDTTDYLWYTTRFKLQQEDLPWRKDIHPVLQVASLGHGVHAFANGQYLGNAHGSKIEKSFVLQKVMNLKRGTNHITILAMTVGFPDSGPYLERRLAGIRSVAIQGLNTGTLDLTANGWGHKVGFRGEKLRIYSNEGVSRVQWTKAKSNVPITWYKRYFDTPHGTDPVIIDMSTMAKGLVWVNGEGIGRYWVSNLSPLGTPTQTVYHIPRSFLNQTKNLLVVFEESGGNPEGIQIFTVRRDDICTYVSEYHPGVTKSWSRKEGQLRSVVEDVKPESHLKCPDNKVIQAITFASFGNPSGVCGNYTIGSCHAPQTKLVVEKVCLGKASCVLPVKGEVYGADANCPETTATLAVQIIIIIIIYRLRPQKAEILVEGRQNLARVRRDLTRGLEDDRVRRRRRTPGQNNPLYLQSFTEADDALKLHHIVHCSLDVIEERVNNPKKSGPTLNETFLGLLYPTENYKVYGYLTNSKVKFILVTTDLDVRDADVRNFFRWFHSAYVDAVSNPFHLPGKKITSKTFASRISTLVKSFGSTAPA